MNQYQTQPRPSGIFVGMKRVLPLMGGLLFGASALVALGGTALAFGGCVNSPENPTWILAGIGAVAAGLPWLRAAVKRRRHDQ